MILRPNTSDAQVYDDVFVRQYHVPPGQIVPSSILDLGANIGLTMLHYSQLWPDAKIIGVELDAENAELARLNSGKEVINVAVAATSGIRHYASEVDPCTYRLSPGGDRSIQAMTFTDILTQIGGVDFVKMDIEGAEWEVLETSGWESLVKWILVEVHNGTCEKMIELLSTKGFDAYKHAPHWSAVWGINLSL